MLQFVHAETGACRSMPIPTAREASTRARRRIETGGGAHTGVVLADQPPARLRPSEPRLAGRAAEPRRAFRVAIGQKGEKPVKQNQARG